MNEQEAEELYKIIAEMNERIVRLAYRLECDYVDANGTLYECFVNTAYKLDDSVEALAAVGKRLKQIINNKESYDHRRTTLHGARSRNAQSDCAVPQRPRRSR